MKEHLEQHKEEYKRWLVDNEQGRIDIKILPYLPEKGFFVEAGALDGLFMNNTKILEDLGWEGLLVEPSHKAVEKCRENRKCIIEECALVSSSYPFDTVEGDFNYDGTDGLGAWSSVNRGNPAENVSVKARTLDSLLEKHNVTKVDLLSLDVEGYEIEVLKGLDLNKTEVSNILVEVNLTNYTLGDMDNYLGQFGYKNIRPISNFSMESNPGWNGLHQDYLYTK